MPVRRKLHEENPTNKNIKKTILNLIQCLIVSCQNVVFLAVWAEIENQPKIKPITFNRGDFMNHRFLYTKESNINEYLTSMQNINENDFPRQCAKDVGGFSVMFFIVFFAFAQLGYILFGASVSFD
jgi:hypothetical protein